MRPGGPGSPTCETANERTPTARTTPASSEHQQATARSTMRLPTESGILPTRRTTRHGGCAGNVYVNSLQTERDPAVARNRSRAQHSRGHRLLHSTVINTDGISESRPRRNRARHSTSQDGRHERQRHACGSMNNASGRTGKDRVPDRVQRPDRREIRRPVNLPAPRVSSWGNNYARTRIQSLLDRPRRARPGCPSWRTATTRGQLHVTGGTGSSPKRMAVRLHRSRRSQLHHQARTA